MRSLSASHVDTNSLFIFTLKNNKNCQIIAKCGFGFDYNNHVELIFEKNTINADFIFSKPKKYTPSIRVRNGPILKKELNYKNIDQFKLMFNHILFSKKLNIFEYYKNLINFYKFFYRNK